MREDYKAAKKLAEEAVRKAEKEGKSPYLPVLDAQERRSSGQTRLGLQELPISRIKGNKEISRNNAFANNFMPLMDEGTEFSQKWSDLYDSYRQEGIRDAIKVYEYMHDYYVQEGNKRVSVSNYGKTEFIVADVIRILPENDGSPEVKAYYEFIDFYRLTKNFLIVLRTPGRYKLLANLLGQDLEHEWPKELCADLKSAFFRFSKCMKNQLKITDENTVSNAFVMYLAIFPLPTILDSSDELIAVNIRKTENDLLVSGALDRVSFLDSAGEEKKPETSFWDLFAPKAKKYTESSPLRVGFVYDEDIETSRWSDSHEAGRLYVESVNGKNVVTQAYVASQHEGIKEAIHHAIHDKCDLVFTTAPSMLQETLRAAVQFPQTKLLNCTLGRSVASLQCYQGRLYEASFLMGILAADQLLRAGVTGERRIGYLSRYRDSRRSINLNAFAIGVSLIDPECRISLLSILPGQSTDFRAKWKEEGVKIYADFEYAVGRQEERPGVYMMGEEKDVHLGTPFYNWGKFYSTIVHSVLMGSWNLQEATNKQRAMNYWFGLSTGVVDIRTKGLPYQTEKLLGFMKKGIINGEFSPFSGEIRARDGRVIQEQTASRDGDKDTLENMTPSKIITMDWLYENIEGNLER